MTAFSFTFCLPYVKFGNIKAPIPYLYAKKDTFPCLRDMSGKTTPVRTMTISVMKVVRAGLASDNCIYHVIVFNRLT